MHTHIFSPRMIARREDYIRQDKAFAELYASPKSRMITASELVDSMDKQGIDMSMVCNVGWTSHQLCIESNDYILESIKHYPRRLLGLAAIQPCAGDKAVYELERCLQEGARGIGEMRPDTQGFDMTDDNLLTAVVNCLVSHNSIWLTHASEPVGHPYPGKGGVTPQLLYPFICRYPDLNIVLAHWGGGMPFYALMPEVKKALARVYFDTAASPYLYDNSIYACAAALTGVEHILFGTDFPLIPQSRILRDIDNSVENKADREHIKGINAQHLLGIR